MSALDSKLDALADPTRRAIVELLVQQPHRASDLADATGVTRSRMSKHLRILLDAGIARDERPAHDARSRVFSLKPDAMNDMRSWLERLQRQWDAQLLSFKEHVDGQADRSDSKDARQRPDS